MRFANYENHLHQLGRVYTENGRYLGNTYLNFRTGVYEFISWDGSYTVHSHQNLNHLESLLQDEPHLEETIKYGS